MKKLNIQQFNKILISEMLEKQKADTTLKKDKDKEVSDKDVQLKPQTTNYSIGDILSKQLILKHIESKNKYTVANIDYNNKKIIAYAAAVDDEGNVKLDPVSGQPEMMPFTIDFKDITDYVIA